MIVCLMIAAKGMAASLSTVELKIVDETGAPIKGVRALIEIDGEDYKKYEGVTGTNGLFSAQGKIPALVGYDGQKEGYYRSLENFYFLPDKSRPGSRIEKRTLTMRKIIDPKEGKRGSTRSGSSWLEIPAYDKAIGFDLLESDWVAPYGKGKDADFVFTFSKDTTNKTLSYVLTFSNDGDGIMEYPFKNIQSVFRWPHNAPLDGYNTSLKKYLIYESSPAVLSSKEEMKMNTEINYIFRVRTQYDATGNIASALYGKISGELGMWPVKRDVLKFGYWLNTDPTSRSLESTHPTSP